MYIIMLGAPGAGKGTQAGILSQKVGLPHVASGDLFRQAVEQGTGPGRLAKSYMDRGELVPDDVTTRMILERINRPDCAAGCILDGFPRTLHQAEALDEAMGERGESIDRVVYIEVPDEELVKRLSGRLLCRSCQTPYHVENSPPQITGRCDKCGGELYQRSDDREETVRDRLAVFSDQTAPLLRYYRNQGKLVTVDGNLDVEGVAARVVSALKIPASL